MSEGPYFPLFCTVETSLEFINSVVQAAYDEQNNNPRLQNSWVLIQTRDQEIFPMPSPLLSRYQSEFRDWGLPELGAFCKARFARTGLICAEDFAIIDRRTLKDKTLLFARWEQYTPEDDAILRIIWGDSKPEQEKWLKDSFMTPEDAALYRQAAGDATLDDEVLIRKFKDEAIEEDDHAIEKVKRVQDEAIIETDEDDVRSDSTQPDQHFVQQLELATALKTPKEKLITQQALASPRLSKGSHSTLEVQQAETKPKIEILEGLRTIRIPIESAMRDVAVVYRRSITDLLKISSLFDEQKVLRY